MLHAKQLIYFCIFVCNFILVTGCTFLSSEGGVDVVMSESTQTPTIPISSPNTVSEKSTEEAVTTNINISPSESASLAETSLISPTIALISPRIKDVQCDELVDLFVAPQADVAPLHVIRSHILVDDAIIYMGIKQYIRVFDVSNLATPSLLSVWELPIVAEISDMEAHDSVGYIASGSALHLFNLSSICQPDLLTTIEMPFEISQLEKEEDRLYVGGYERDESGVSISGLYITTFSVHVPTHPQELTTINLEEPAIWSVNNQKFYFETDSGLYFSNIEELSPEMQPINIMLDPQIIVASTPKLVGDTLYLHSWSDGVVIIKHLGSATPAIEHRRYAYPLSSFFEIHEDYITVGYSKMCDEPECSSRVYVLSVENGKELSEISFEPYGEVYRYLQIQKDIIYAFSTDSLFIVDLANLANPTVTRHVLRLP